MIRRTSGLGDDVIFALPFSWMLYVEFQLPSAGQLDNWSKEKFVRLDSARLRRRDDSADAGEQVDVVARALPVARAAAADAPAPRGALRARRRLPAGGRRAGRRRRGRRARVRAVAALLAGHLSRRERHLRRAGRRLHVLRGRRREGAAQLGGRPVRPRRVPVRPRPRRVRRSRRSTRRPRTPLRRLRTGHTRTTRT